MKIVFGVVCCGDSTDSGYLWEVKKIHSENPCLQCGSMETVRAGKCTTTVREEAVRSVALWLKIHKHRIYCKDCKKTFTEPEPGIWREEDQRRDLGRLSLRTVGR